MSILGSRVSDNPLFVILILLLVFGSIVVGVILLKKYVKPFQNDEKPKSPEETAKEEMERILVDVEDEKTANEIASFKTVTKNDDDEGEDKPIIK